MTDNPQLRRTLRRSLQGAGSVVEFPASASALTVALGAGVAGAEPDLVVLDPQSRREVDLARLSSLGRTQVMVVGESIAEEDVLTLLREPLLNHVFSDVNASEEETLVVTSGKVRRGDIFGVEKYLAWGALVHERAVKTYEAKREALLEVAAYAGDVGARRQVIARIESVTDELLMNALYDAPAIRHGTAHAEAQKARHGWRAEERTSPAILRYACDGRYLGVSVRDSYGELRKDAILDHILRARAMKGSPKIKPSGGAGLGLYFVITSVTRFIANIAPGRLTEVIGLFDIQATGRDQEACARSLHIFTVPGTGGALTPDSTRE
jgi:hypothetical protein